MKSSLSTLSGSSSKIKSSSKQSLGRNKRSIKSSSSSRFSTKSDGSSGGPTYNFSDNLGKRCFTFTELNQIQRCCPFDEPYVPQCICVQQTPSIVCHKNIVWVQKVKHEPAVVNTTRYVMVPKVVKVSKAVKIPEVIWTEGYTKVPKIEYRKQKVTEYNIKQAYKDIMAPQEICTSFLCRPKPQYILIPPPTDYCCYPLNTLNSSGPIESQVEEHLSQLAYRAPAPQYSNQQNYSNPAHLRSSMGGDAYNFQDSLMRNSYGNEPGNGYGNSYPRRGTEYDSHRLNSGSFMPAGPMFNSNPYQPNYGNSLPYNNYSAPYPNHGYGHGSFTRNGMSQPIYAAAA